MRKIDKIPYATLLNSFFLGNLIRVGFLFLLVSGIFISVFVPNIDTLASKYEEEETILSNGILTEIIETSSIVNDQRIYQYNYSFNFDGNTLHGSSYAYLVDVNVQDTVSIEVIANLPSISRIKGMRNGAFSAEFLYVFPIIFIIGLVLIVYSIYRNLLLLRVLKNGFEIVPAELVSELKFSKPFSRKSDQYYKLEYRYSIQNRQLKKIVFAQLSEFQLNRIRYSGMVIGPDSGDKGFVFELLPSKIKKILMK
jgi:hypothetical protein